MKKKIPYVKLTLDILMGITFALLYNTRVLGGLAFHEIAGAAIGAAFVTHILLNLKFVQKITVRLFDRALPARTRFSYLLSVLLLLSMALVIFSGLVISRVLLPNFQFGNENWFKMAHMSVAYLALGLIGVHIGLHWHWVIKMFQKILHLKVPKPLSRILMSGAAVLVLAFGIYQVYTTDYLSKLEMVKSMFTTSAAAGKGGFDHEGGFNREGAAPMGNDTSSANGGTDSAAAAGSVSSPTSGSDSSTDSSSVESSSPDTASYHGDKSFGAPEGGFKGRGGGDGVKGGDFGSASWYKVLLTYFGIMAVFAGITYYLDKWISSRKKRVRKTVQHTA